MSPLYFWIGCILISLGGLCLGASMHEALRPLLFVSLPCNIVGFLLVKKSIDKKVQYKLKNSGLGIAQHLSKTGSNFIVNSSKIWIHNENFKHQLIDLEKQIDKNLKIYLSILSKTISGYTYSVFIPLNVHEWKLHSYLSTSQYMNSEASIVMGSGLLGFLHKDGIDRILECDIVTDSTKLGLYKKNERIRSLLAVPIIVEGQKRGAVVIDSLNPNAFKERDVTQIKEFVQILGDYLYRAYISIEYRYQKEQIAKELEKLKF